MRMLDARVISGLGLPGIALMELAAHGAAEIIRRRHDTDARKGVSVVCGPGNNGGDGWAIARWLSLWGYPVSVSPVAEPREGTDAAIMRSVARAQGIGESPELLPAGIVVDALFGTGITREVTGPFASSIESMNRSGLPIVAIDVPSGLHTDTGEEMGVAVRAARTVTFGREKLGFFLSRAPEHTGPVDVVDIGLGAATGRGDLASAEIPEDAELMSLWPRRSALDHKGSLGHLLVIAGSAAMTGAAILACSGALAAGIGRITLLATSAMRARLTSLPPEVMLLEGGEGDRLEQLPPQEVLARFDALVVGPGLCGGQPPPRALASELSRLWASDPRPWIADADALPLTGPSDRPRVITPHPGEAARLLSLGGAEIERDRVSAVQRLSSRGTALLKGRYTLIQASGAPLSINASGDPSLATGGSGDVLAGFIGALLARGLSPRDAARLGAHAHGRAGEHLGSERREGWTASDVARALKALAP